MNRLKLILTAGLMLLFGWTQAQDSVLVDLNKGRMYTGLTFSVASRQMTNDNQLIRVVTEGHTSSYTINQNSGYFIKKDFSLGLILGFTQSLQDLQYIADGVNYHEQKESIGWSVAPNMRNYLSLGNERFRLFNQTALSVAKSNGLRRLKYESTQERFRTEVWEFGLGFTPGMSAFISDGLAVEVGANVLGLTSRIDRTYPNDDEVQEVVTNNVDFRISVLSLYFGLTFYY